MTHTNTKPLSLYDELTLVSLDEIADREADERRENFLLDSRSERKEARFQRKYESALKIVRSMDEKSIREAYRNRNAFDYRLCSNAPFIKACEDVLDEIDSERQSKALDEVRDEIEQACAYAESHPTDKTALCGICSLLDEFSDLHKSIYGRRFSPWYLVPDSIKPLLEAISIEEMDRFYELSKRPQGVAPYEV